jgi:lipoyl(octanoyl) transferase
MSAVPRIRFRGLVDYGTCLEAMQRFTDLRGPATADEIWFLEHPPVFTLGLNARREHLLDPGAIPVVASDRGGQVTYHGPGQLVVYPLLDLRRHPLGVRELVTGLEGAVIDYAAEFGVAAEARRDAPGVYVRGAKLASIGLRVRRGASYHGLSLNVGLELAPFRRIDVCGHRDMAVTRLCDLCAVGDVDTAARGLIPHLLRNLKFAATQSAISTAAQAVSAR